MKVEPLRFIRIRSTEEADWRSDHLGWGISITHMTMMTCAYGLRGTVLFTPTTPSPAKASISAWARTVYR